MLSHPYLTAANVDTDKLSIPEPSEDLNVALYLFNKAQKDKGREKSIAQYLLHKMVRENPQIMVDLFFYLNKEKIS